MAVLEVHVEQRAKGLSAKADALVGLRITTRNTRASNSRGPPALAEGVGFVASLSPHSFVVTLVVVVVLVDEHRLVQ
jgi:hypothetical protein